VHKFATSDPPPGSVIARALIFSPDKIFGKTLAFICSEPRFEIGGAPIL